MHRIHRITPILPAHQVMETLQLSVLRTIYRSIRQALSFHTQAVTRRRLLCRLPNHQPYDNSMPTILHQRQCPVGHLLGLLTAIPDPRSLLDMLPLQNLHPTPHIPTMEHALHHLTVDHQSQCLQGIPVIFQTLSLCQVVGRPRQRRGVYTGLQTKRAMDSSTTTFQVSHST